MALARCSHKIDEDEDLFDQPQFEKMDPEIRKRAKEVYKKLRSTIKEIPRSLQKRGDIVVETAVSNDNRPESFLAAHNSRRISHDKRGIPYLQKGAKSSSLLLKAVGPPLKAIEMPLPEACSKEYGFQWTIIDEFWSIPESNIGPLERTAFKDQSPWNQASGILDKALRVGGTRINFQEGGWVDAYSALAAVSRELKKWYTLDVVGQIATVNWLFALMFDTKWDPTVESRYQLAGTVDSDGVLVQICYVRNKSGHNTEVARLIPDETLYTKITEGSLEYISCICHKTKFENLESTFAIGLVLGGISSTSDRAHMNFTAFPPFGARNLAPGRRGKEFNVVIVFKPGAMLRYNIGLSLSAFVVTSCNIPWTTIELIYAQSAY